MEAFSLAVRRRIIELFQSGLEGDDVAGIMACSPAAARRIWQRYREEGLIGPRPHAIRPRGSSSGWSLTEVRRNFPCPGNANRSRGCRCFDAPSL